MIANIWTYLNISKHHQSFAPRSPHLCQVNNFPGDESKWSISAANTGDWVTGWLATFHRKTIGTPSYKPNFLRIPAEVSKLRRCCKTIWVAFFERWRAFQVAVQLFDLHQLLLNAEQNILHLPVLTHQTSYFQVMCRRTCRKQNFLPLSDHNLSLDDHLDEARFGTQHLALDDSPSSPSSPRVSSTVAMGDLVPQGTSLLKKMEVKQSLGIDDIAKIDGTFQLLPRLWLEDILGDRHDRDMNPTWIQDPNICDTYMCVGLHWPHIRESGVPANRLCAWCCMEAQRYSHVSWDGYGYFMPFRGSRFNAFLQDMSDWTSSITDLRNGRFVDRKPHICEFSQNVQGTVLGQWTHKSTTYHSTYAVVFRCNWGMVVLLDLSICIEEHLRACGT